MKTDIKKQSADVILVQLHPLSLKQYALLRDAGYTKEESVLVNNIRYQNLRTGFSNVNNSLATKRQLDYIAKYSQIEHVLTFREARSIIRSICKTEDHDEKYLEYINYYENDNKQRKSRTKNKV